VCCFVLFTSTPQSSISVYSVCVGMLAVAIYYVNDMFYVCVCVCVCACVSVRACVRACVRVLDVAIHYVNDIFWLMSDCNAVHVYICVCTHNNCMVVINVLCGCGDESLSLCYDEWHHAVDRSNLRSSIESCTDCTSVCLLIWVWENAN